MVGQKDPVDTVSLYAEDRMRLEMRVIRVTHPHAYSQDFPTRTSHVVGNVMLDPENGRGFDGGLSPKADLVVRSSVQILEFRKEEQRLFGGTVRHWLRRARRRFPHRPEAHRPRQLRCADGSGAALPLIS